MTARCTSPRQARPRPAYPRLPLSDLPHRLCPVLDDRPPQPTSRPLRPRTTAQPGSQRNSPTCRPSPDLTRTMRHDHPSHDVPCLSISYSARRPTSSRASAARLASPPHTRSLQLDQPGLTASRRPISTTHALPRHRSSVLVDVPSQPVARLTDMPRQTASAHHQPTSRANPEPVIVTIPPGTSPPVPQRLPWPSQVCSRRIDYPSHVPADRVVSPL